MASLGGDPRKHWREGRLERAGTQSRYVNKQMTTMGNWGSVQLGNSRRLSTQGVRVQGIYPSTPQSLVEGCCRRTGGSINSMAFLTVPRTGLPRLSRQRKPSSKELRVLATES